MATTVHDRAEATGSRLRRAARVGYRCVFGGLHALDGLLIAASAGVQYALARRR